MLEMKQYYFLAQYTGSLSLAFNNKFIQITSMENILVFPHYGRSFPGTIVSFLQPFRRSLAIHVFGKNTINEDQAFKIAL